MTPGDSKKKDGSTWYENMEPPRPLINTHKRLTRVRRTDTTCVPCQMLDPDVEKRANLILVAVKLNALANATKSLN
jgi:hypothetical protein